ncbi:MAG: chromate transporter [Firmicutes bacterium]|nr:chromate transporter [Bacillota bacterium]
MTYLTLIFEFFKTGLFAVGGGLATLPFLRDMALRYPWFTMEELLNMIAVSESTPGPIGINMSTYSGVKAGSILGGIIATLSIIAPSIIVIVIIASVKEKFQNSVVVQRGFYLLRAATAGLIAGAVFEVIVVSLFNLGVYAESGQLLSLVRWPSLILFGTLVVLIKKLPKVHPVVFIVASAILGVIFKL